ncbi:hypothetical protein Hamer_G021583 [Homarus americanus]|uniref:Uncharacterized protein n=1 Tax=Homarus americanus TaxID=6706 RepID=A0A8J5MZK0_HOMAM|nr:hypothetical protein Hamer_G021583 [Homarus americanus]
MLHLPLQVTVFSCPTKLGFMKLTQTMWRSCCILTEILTKEVVDELEKQNDVEKKEYNSKEAPSKNLTPSLRASTDSQTMTLTGSAAVLPGEVFKQASLATRKCCRRRNSRQGSLP